MRALFDVNMLLALLDAAHVHHERAKNWLMSQADPSWASCPLTQNGFVRILSQPSYPGHLSVHSAAKLLAEATVSVHHEFWPDDLSLLDEAAFETTRIHGPGQLTDAYLLGLAAYRGGRLVALDRSIAISGVPRAKSSNLVIL